MKSFQKLVNRLGLFLLFLICGISLPALSGLLIFPFSLIPSNYDLIYRISLSIIFFLFAFVPFKNVRLKKYWKVLFSFFIATFAINLQATTVFLNFQTTPINILVISMVSSTLLIIIPIIMLSLISGDSISTLFIERGNLKLGLIIGLIGFLLFAVISIPEATFLFQGRNLNLDRVISWSPWIFIIVIANGVREELLYRGLFLKKYDLLFGPKYSNVLQAIIFSLSHTVAGRGTVAYTQYTVVLVLFTFLLGIACGYFMQRTKSLLGSVLFHAGSDIAVFIGIFSNLP